MRLLTLVLILLPIIAISAAPATVRFSNSTTELQIDLEESTVTAQRDVSETCLLVVSVQYDNKLLYFSICSTLFFMGYAMMSLYQNMCAIYMEQTAPMMKTVPVSRL